MEKSGVSYSIGKIIKDESELYVAQDVQNALSTEYSDKRINLLSDAIIKLLNDKNESIAPTCIDGITWDDIPFSPTETLISYLLFERGVTFCNIAMRNGDMDNIDHAFVNFNFAIHFSISPEMLGLCCLYRAFFLPKENSGAFAANSIMQNELNISKRVIDVNSDMFRRFVGNYQIVDTLPDVCYIFLSENHDENSRYKYTYRISPIVDFIPILSPNPNICFESVKEVNGFLSTIIQSPDYQLLSQFKFDKNAFEVKYLN